MGPILWMDICFFVLFENDIWDPYYGWTYIHLRKVFPISMNGLGGHISRLTTKSVCFYLYAHLLTLSKRWNLFDEMPFYFICPRAGYRNLAQGKLLCMVHHIPFAVSSHRKSLCNLIIAWQIFGHCEK